MANRNWPSDIDRICEAIHGLQKSLECTICLEFLTEPIKTRCGHSFCKTCVGKVLKMKDACCPLCKKSLNRRNISKDDDLQTYIEKFKNLVTAIQNDTNIEYTELLSHSKKPCNTKESCSYSDYRHPSQDFNKEKHSKKSSCQSNQNANRQIDKPSTSRETMIDRDNPRCGLKVSNEKPETLPNLYSALPSDETCITDAKIRSWLYQFPHNLSTDKSDIDDSIAKNKKSSIEDEAQSIISLSDKNNKFDKIVEVHRNRINAKCRSSQNRKQSTDCSERIDEDNTLSQMNKEANQIDKELNSTSNKLKYKTFLTKIRAKENREKNAKSSVEETNSQNSSSSWMTAYDPNATAMPSCLGMKSTSAISEQSTANWLSMIEFEKEMKRGSKRKVKKLNVSIEKNKNLPRIIEDVILSERNKYDSARLAASHKKSEKETNISPESSDRKQNAIDKNLNLSDAKVKALIDTNNQMELFDEDGANCLKSMYLINTSATLEEDRQTDITNLNINQINKIIGLDNVAKDCEKNSTDYSNVPPSQRKRLTAVTSEKLNESDLYEHERIRNISQTSTDNFETLSDCLSAEKQSLGSQEISNVQETLDETVSSQLSSTSKKGRLSLKKKRIDNKSVESPLLSDYPLSYRFSIDINCISDRKNVNSPVSKDDKLFESQLKVVRRDLNFKIREIQQRTDQATISANASKGIIEIENNNENVSKILHQDKKFSHNFTGESTVSKKYLSTKSKSIENQGRQSLVKFIQLGLLNIKRLNRYFYAGPTKREMSMPAEVRVTSVCNMQLSRSEMYAATCSNPWNDSQNSNNITMVENIYFAKNNNLNSNEVVSKEFPALQICTASATSTPKKKTDSHLNETKNTKVVHSSLNANQQLNKSIENITEKNAQFFHKPSYVDKNVIHGISHIYPGTSKSIKLLSPDKDSQLKFLAIDSPTSERDKLRRASSIKSVIKGNNFSEMKNSHLETSTLAEAQESFIENLCKKRKRMRYTNDRELFEDRLSDENDSSNSATDSSRSTIKLDRYNELSRKANSSRLDEHKKRRLSSSDDQDVEEISSVSKQQNAPRRKSKISSSDSESETHVTKNLKSDNQCAQRNSSITDSATKQCSTKQDSENLRMRNIIDKWSNEHTVQTKLMKESKNSQNSLKSTKSQSEEILASHQSSHSSNALNMEKNSKPSQKSFARESDIFESSSFFNSDNVDYILQSTKNANDTSKKIANSSNDDIINKVLQIDRSRSNTEGRSDSVSRNDTTSQREKDNRELLQDNFDEIIANVEQLQSEDFIPCSEQPDHNPNRPLTKQKTSNCLTMIDESCGIIQETLTMSPSSTNDMFYSSRNIKKLSATNAISKFQETFNEWIIKHSDKENVACNQKRHGYMGDQRDKSNSLINIDTFDKDSRKTVTSKHNVSREKEKFPEERNVLIQSASRLDVNNDKIYATVTDNESISKDDTFDDSLMNITQHQVRLQMFERDLFDTVSQNQIKTTKMNSQNDPSQREQRTPKKRKQNIQDKNTEPEECFADEDDIVENTPEKKMKNSGNSMIESGESAKPSFLTPLLKKAEWTPNTSKSHQIVNPLSGSSTPIKLEPSSQMIFEMRDEDKKNERIRNDGILLAKQMNANMLENVHWQPDKRDLCFVCSGLSAKEIITVKEFAAKHNASYVNQFDDNVTHVIVKTIGEQNMANSTLKYLQGIAHRKWLVSYRWIEDCNMQQKLLDEIPYEATTHTDVVTNGAGPRNSRLRDKDLFEGFTFLCIEPYDNVSLNQYEDLLRATGATVVDSFEALDKMGGLKGVVIQDNIHDDKTIEYWYRTLKAAPILVDWIVECIGHYKLLKLTPYSPCLSPQDFCAIGYPRELIEEDEDYSDNE